MSTLMLDNSKYVATERDRQMMDLLTPFGAEQFPLVPFGAEVGGYATEGDIVYVTSDGLDVNNLWDEALTVLSVWNQRRNQLVGLFTFPVTSETEAVPQVGEATFEEASEFGEPQGERLRIAYFQLGYDFRDYDRATRFTWKALRDMDARQVRAVNNALLQADERLVFRKVMEAIFDNRNREANIRGQAYAVYPLYNADGTVPPTYRGTTFDGTHRHYIVSNNATIDSGDLEDAYDHIAEHGYTIEAGTQIVHFMNRKQIKEVRKFRAGVENNNTVEATYDFIPARTQPAQFLDSPLGLLGSLPPDTWNGLRVIGSYGDALIIEEPFIPEDYFLTIGTGGAGNLQNLVGLREHKNPAYRGLRILPGNQQAYPLVDSYYTRAFGTGIRQRAGGVVTQIKVGAADSYVIPTQYTRGLGFVA